MRQSATIRMHISVRLILLLVFAVHLLYPLSYGFRINRNREEQSAIILSEYNEKYQVLRLDKNMYKRALRDEGKELRLNGKMYDIVSIKHSEESIICTVLPDDKETELDKELASDVKKNESGKTPKWPVNWQPVLYVQTNFTSLLFTDIIHSPYPITGTCVLPVGHMHVIERPPRNV